ncbi:excinuclease ABC subunit UvrC [Agathobaculum sp.]|uniref:excinuclease ABC subunit UvrC n=1 Tax=Agathobaculum sp. TaxID=2048138 RepID=UPI002A82F22B|nr:excinuclease ABC subunit UvrC [Agathobaculum sp.]MDY3617533.1 excinuclease ABC subunit UvrC [Agathobaculum sp.]
MTREQLRERVRKLPLSPGVYLHKDRTGKVIYVGKAKALRNRVSNYFQTPERLNAKTRQLVSHIDDFDIIVTETEFEALVLENSMIKKYKPKYNILLKDDKGYPYIRLTVQADYPSFSVVSKPAQDGARYFGPYPGRVAARRAIDTISEALQLKTCSRVFPRDIGKDRPCLNQHLGRCCAPCTGRVPPEEYKALIAQAIALFEGNAKALERELNEKMAEASEQLQFERAAVLRDRLRAVQKLGSRQHVVAGAFAELDVIAFVQGETRACVCVLHYGGGALQDKEYTLFHVTESDPPEVLAAFIKQYYAQRGAAPKTVLLSHELEEQEAIAEYLSSIAERRVELAVPQRGERRTLTRLAEKNAREEIERREQQSERRHKSLELLQNVTGMIALPLRLEAYDISNFAGQDTVGSMVVFIEGQPKKSDYRKFKIECAANGQDDYASMREMLTRRVQRYVDGDEKFSPLPNAFLIDGGLGHVRICKEVLDSFRLDTPCFGMVKDDKHRTRALIAPDGREFGISATPALFALIGRIQEEVHRFAITYNRQLGGKKVRGSTLDKIPSVGDKRRSELLRHFGSIDAIKKASESDLTRVVPRNTAHAVYEYFHTEDKQ